MIQRTSAQAVVDVEGPVETSWWSIITMIRVYNKSDQKIRGDSTLERWMQLVIEQITIVQA